MPFADSDGGRIRYEVLGSGPPLVLHTGFIIGLEDWAEEGYVAALQDRYRLILIDPRGQGRSDAPHAPGAYTLAQRVRDVLAVLDATGTERAHFWGYSMGGRIGYAVGIHLPERLRTLVIGGAGPFSGNPRPIAGDPFVETLRVGMPLLITQMIESDPSLGPTADQSRRWLDNDTDALIAARRASLTEPDLDRADVAAIALPTLIYCGTDDDPAACEEAARLMPHARYVPLEGLNHITALRRSDLVLPIVEAFLAEHAALT